MVPSSLWCHWLTVAICCYCGIDCCCMSRRQDDGREWNPKFYFIFYFLEQNAHLWTLKYVRTSDDAMIDIGRANRLHQRSWKSCYVNDKLDQENTTTLHIQTSTWAFKGLVGGRGQRDWCFLNEQLFSSSQADIKYAQASVQSLLQLCKVEGRERGEWGLSPQSRARRRRSSGPTHTHIHTSTKQQHLC